MKKNRLSLLLAVVMLFFCGCGAADDARRDLDSVVAVVCGEEITKRMVMNQWDRQKASMGVNDEYELSDDGQEIIAYVLENLLGDMTKTVIRRHAARELGLYPLCEAARERMNAYADAMYDRRVSEMQEALASGAAEGDAFASAQSAVAAQMEGQFAFSREMDLREAEDMVITELLKDYYGRDIAADEADIAAYYDSLLTEQKTAFSADTTRFAAALEEGGLILYQPGETVRVKQVLLGFDEEVQAQIASYRNSGRGNKAQETLDAAAAELLPAAREIEAAARDGADFDELIAESGTDPDMMTGAGRQAGRLISRDSDDTEALRTAALALEKPGDISEPVLTDYGYHILYAMEVYEEKTVEQDTVTEELTAQYLDQERSAAYIAAMEAAYEETPAEYYIGRLLRGSTNTIGLDPACLAEERRLDV